MTENSANSRCRAITKQGKPCRAAATEGGLCFFHANPNKASELGRIGGGKAKPQSFGETMPLHRLNNAGEVRDTVARLIGETYSGQLSPTRARGLAPLLSLQLRAIEVSDLEQRIRELEARRDDSALSNGGLVDENFTGEPGKKKEPS